MLDPFTDQQLIELIQSKAPDDLSSDEVDRLRLPQTASLDSSEILQQSQLDPELAKDGAEHADAGGDEQGIERYVPQCLPVCEPFQRHPRHLVVAGFEGVGFTTGDSPPKSAANTNTIGIGWMRFIF